MRDNDCTRERDKYGQREREKRNEEIKKSWVKNYMRNEVSFHQVIYLRPKRNFGIYFTYALLPDMFLLFFHVKKEAREKDGRAVILGPGVMFFYIFWWALGFCDLRYARCSLEIRFSVADEFDNEKNSMKDARFLLFSSHNKSYMIIVMTAHK